MKSCKLTLFHNRKYKITSKTSVLNLCICWYISCICCCYAMLIIFFREWFLWFEFAIKWVLNLDFYSRSLISRFFFTIAKYVKRPMKLSTKGTSRYFCDENFLSSIWSVLYILALTRKPPQKSHHYFFCKLVMRRFFTLKGYTIFTAQVYQKLELHEMSL